MIRLLTVAGGVALILFGVRFLHKGLDRHFARLNAGLIKSHKSSAIHLDILTHLKRINSHVSHAAYALFP